MPKSSFVVIIVIDFRETDFSLPSIVPDLNSIVEFYVSLLKRNLHAGSSPALTGDLPPVVPIQLYHASRIVELRVVSYFGQRYEWGQDIRAVPVSRIARVRVYLPRSLSPIEMTDYSYSTDVQHSATNERKREESVSTLWPGVISSGWIKLTFQWVVSYFWVQKLAHSIWFPDVCILWIQKLQILRWFEGAYKTTIEIVFRDHLTELSRNGTLDYFTRHNQYLLKVIRYWRW